MNFPQKLNVACRISLRVCSKPRDGWNLLAAFLIVLIRLAVEKNVSPVALVEGLTWINLQTTMTLPIICFSFGRRPLTAVKFLGSIAKGLNWATRTVTLTSPLNFDNKSSTSLEVFSPLAALISRVSRLAYTLKASWLKYSFMMILIDPQLQSWASRSGCELCLGMSVPQYPFHSVKVRVVSLEPLA